jgi:hypothetical protein
MAIYRVTIFGHMQTGEEWNTTWHVNKVSGEADQVATDGADAVTAAWSGVTSPTGRLDAYYSADLGVDGVRCDELDSSGLNVAQAVDTLALVGTSTDELLPPNVAVGVSLRTNSPTRFGRGRNFLPSPVVTTVLAQKLDTTVQTAIKNAWLRGLNHMSSASSPVVIFHRNNGGFDLVTAVDVGDVFDVQNDRRNQQVETRVRSALS